MSTDDLRKLYRIACTEADRYTDLAKRGHIKSTADWQNYFRARLRRAELVVQLMDRSV